MLIDRGYMPSDKRWIKPEPVMPEVATVCYTFRLVDEYGQKFVGVKQAGSLAEILDQLRRSHIDYRQVYLEYQFSCDDSGRKLD